MCLWNLTVRETVMFAAKLRLPQSTPENVKDERVTELVELLGLSHIADSIIGKEGRRGISGGERKRVSIGVELITSPDVLFLDEPTSGLGKLQRWSGLTRIAVYLVNSVVNQPTAWAAGLERYRGGGVLVHTWIVLAA